jgi:hypothetical protein
MEYIFFCFGHPNIRAEHVKTIEFTKDTDLTERGDCILGIRSTFEREKLKQFSKKVRFVCEVTDGTGGTVRSEFKCRVNPRFSNDHELVLRKSGFASERTFGLALNRGANWLDRKIVELMHNPMQKMKVTVKSGWGAN